MKIFLYIIIGVAGGLFGGMGMGGGTLLIPLLTLAAGVEQHLAQAINLIAFVPMSVVALLIHKKNGYVEVKQSAPIVVLALGGAVGGSFLAEYAGGFVLRACYGAFLIVLGVIQFYKTVKTALRNKKEKSARASGKSSDLTAKGA